MPGGPASVAEGTETVWSQLRLGKNGGWVSPGREAPVSTSASQEGSTALGALSGVSPFYTRAQVAAWEGSAPGRWGCLDRRATVVTCPEGVQFREGLRGGAEGEQLELGSCGP